MDRLTNASYRLILVSIGCLALGALVFVTPTPVAHAATITVTALSETSAPGVCTLRDAIRAANSNSAVNLCPAGSAVGTDVINFSVAGTIVLTGALPLISIAVTIDGNNTSPLTARIFTLYSPLATGLHAISTILQLHGDAGIRMETDCTAMVVALPSVTPLFAAILRRLALPMDKAERSIQAGDR